MKPRIVASLFVSITFVLLPAFLIGQEVASLTGVVTDKTGAVVSELMILLCQTARVNLPGAAQPMR